MTTLSFEETELWEILLPCDDSIKGDYKLVDWYKYIKSFKMTNGITLFSRPTGYWNDQEERSVCVRIAADPSVIKAIMGLTAKFYQQEAVLCYRISGNCLLGHREKDVQD